MNAVTVVPYIENVFIFEKKREFNVFGCIACIA